MSRASQDRAAVRDELVRLARARGADSSLCPSEAARNVRSEDWRSLMPVVREEAAALADAGVVRVTRAGRQVDAREPGGPIRISLAE